LPFLNHPIQGDDPFYLAIGMHAQIDPLHPNDFRLAAEGIQVDMRGYPHPPLNGWILGLLIALFGEVHEVPFHTVYLVFTLLAVWAMWMIAQRLSARPVWATLLFLATPVFVVNGNSLESDVPFLAFWLLTVALYIRAVNTACLGLSTEPDVTLQSGHWSCRIRPRRQRQPGLLLLASCVAFALASLVSYQAVVLAPILAVYLWDRKRRWIAGWAALTTPFVVLAAWQVWMRLTTGEMPAAVVAGYFSEYGLQRLANKGRNAIALTAHLGWVVFPGLWFVGNRRWWLAAIPAAAGLALDPHPLFLLSFAVGALVVLMAIRGRKADPETRFLSAWVLFFFGASLVIFFAGSARYLLPLAAPAAILAVQHARPRLLAVCFGLQLVLSLALAVTNYQQWKACRDFVASLGDQFKDRRVWINASHGVRFYAEAAGGVPVVRGQGARPGDLILTSELASVPMTTGGGARVEIARREIHPALPLRLYALGSPSAWSSGTGYRPFDIAASPVDILRAETVVEREPALSYLPMNAPEAENQVVSGVHQLEDNAWRWTTGRIVVLLKAPPDAQPLEATFRIVDQSAGTRVILSLDGTEVAEGSYPKAGLYTLRSTPMKAAGRTASVALVIEKTFRVPGDHRELGAILTAIGFRRS
jgi:hypothetical protein